jgi:predicted transcriptional regulator
VDVLAADLVRQARRRGGISQATLGRRAGTTQTYISRVESGDVEPSLKTLTRIIHAAGQRLVISLEPLPHGNERRTDLRRALLDRSADDRVTQAMEISEFLTGVAATAHAQKTHGRG